MADSSRPARRSEKRGAKRRRSRLQVRFWNDDFESSAFTADISDSGLLIETTRKLPQGTRLHLEIRLGERSYYTEATVARQQDYPAYAQSLFRPAIGLRFVGLGEALDRLTSAAQTEEKKHDGEDEPPITTSAQLERADEVPTRTLTRPLRAEPTDSSGTASPSAVQAIDPSWPRVDLRDPMRLHRAYESDLSKGGLLVDSPQAMEFGQVIWVVLQLPPPHAELPVRGQVVSWFSSSSQIGLVLDDRKAIQGRVRQILEGL